VSYSNIVGTPVQIDLRFVPVDAVPPPSDHVLGGFAGVFFRQLIEQELTSPDDLERLLKTPLDQTFDTAWAGQMAAAQAQVIKAIQDADSKAYDINPMFPVTGTLRAQVGALTPVLLDTVPVGTNALQLTLSYLLPSVRVNFSEKAPFYLPDPKLKVTFDAEFLIYIAVPDQPWIPFGVKSAFVTSNTQLAGAGLYGGIALALERLWGNLIGQPFAEPPGRTSGNSNIGGLPQLLSSVAPALAQAGSMGFSQLSVGIDGGAADGNTVTVYLSHPFDPAPGVNNVASPGVFILQSQIGTSAPQVNAGGHLGVVGRAFPPAQARTLVIGWNDTTSGPVTQSEVQWGLSPLGLPPPLPASVLIKRSGSYDNGATFTARGLTPDTSYAFRVRDYDAGNQIATDWSRWLVLTTTSSDQVDLTLNDSANTVIGNASVQVDGTFASTVNVPAAESPGPYMLRAAMSGLQIAETPITVIGAGEALAPVVQVISGSTGLPFTSSDLLVTWTPIHLRGGNFNAGAVELFIDSATGPSLGTAVADLSGSFTASPLWPFGVTGHRTILARQNVLQATTIVDAQDPPR
jgi:hypothetical protein